MKLAFKIVSAVIMVVALLLNFSLLSAADTKNGFLPGNTSVNQSTESSNPQTEIFVRGDVNLDGEVDVVDVAKIERQILEIEPLTLAADVNRDECVDMADVVEIERIIMGISTGP